MFLMGHLQMPPRAAWAVSLVEYAAAWRGYCERHGLNQAGDGMTRRELDALKALYPDET